MLHFFQAPPDSIKIFSYRESKNILTFFCTIYLRNLPLIRLLTLPNHGLLLNHKPEPEYVFSERKDTKKGKKDKKGGKKKGKR